jgi:nicotinate-nucleotide adenylyltransferase
LNKITKKIGIFAGTFDPVHRGHIAFALETVKICKLDKVFFLPEPQPWRKEQVTDIKHRLEMLRIATSESSNLDVIQINDLPFTVAKTLPKLQSEFPDAELTFLMGSDIAAWLPKWPDVEKFLSSAALAVGLRQGSDQAQLQKILAPYSPKVNFIASPYPDLKSSHTRDQKQTKMLPKSVQAYIKTNRLYQ